MREDVSVCNMCVREGGRGVESDREKEGRVQNKGLKSNFSLCYEAAHHTQMRFRLAIELNFASTQRIVPLSLVIPRQVHLDRPHGAIRPTATISESGDVERECSRIVEAGETMGELGLYPMR